MGIAKKTYIRFGLPRKEDSNVYDKRGAVIGEEIGLSVYDVVISHGKLHITLPSPFSLQAAGSLYSLMEEVVDGSRRIYLMSGIEIGKGSDGEPLIVGWEVLDDLTDEVAKE